MDCRSVFPAAPQEKSREALLRVQRLLRGLQPRTERNGFRTPGAWFPPAGIKTPRCGRHSVFSGAEPIPRHRSVFCAGDYCGEIFSPRQVSRLDRYNAICYDNSTLCTAYQLLQYKLIKPGPLARSRVTQVTVECFTHGTVSYSYWFRGCFFAHERLVP